MTVRHWIAMLLVALTLGTGCVRRAVTHDFGLSGMTSQTRKHPSAQSPDTTFRAVFKRQIQGAFNPLSDDARVQGLQERLKANAQDVTARLELGSVYEGYKLYDNAFDQYKEAIPSPIASAAAAEQVVAGLSRSGRASRRSAEAIAPVERLLEQRPSASSWNELGLLYQDVRDFSAAENAFRQAVTLSPESDRAHNNLGYNLLLVNKSEDAEREFRKALESNPSSATARNNLGTLLARRGEFERALEQFQMAADAAAAHNNLAVVLIEMGQYERSREELVKSLALRRYFAPALANFKLVQERIHERAEVQKFGRLPLSVVRVPSALVGQKDSEDKQ